MNDWDNENKESIYQTPDISGQPEEDAPAGEIVEQPSAAAVDTTDMIDTRGVFSGNHQNDHSYGNNSDYGYGNPYANNGYQGYDNNPYHSYGNPQGGNPYGNNGYQGYGNPQNGNPYGNNGYQGYGNPQNGNPYANNSYQGYDNNPYQSYGNPQNGNPYTPYAVPRKKSNTGLIITIVVVLIILLLVAVFALAYKAVDLMYEQKRQEQYDQYDYGYFDYDDDSYGYDDDDSFDEDYDYDSDEYYTLHNDLKTDLSYSVDFENYEYDTDYENVSIMVSYPVIEGEEVPNLEKLNEEIQNEISFFTEYFEEEYEGFIKQNEESYFFADSTGYVAYMDEDKMSVVFEEYMYSDYFSQAYLYCINIDMENGVVLDNEDMLSVDDAFSVDFRTRSDQQNGEISYLTAMTDQQITKYFNSSDIIVFYTPQGMEIGFNYEQGWVTVTYDEYEEYLKVF
ncbi:MAG: hypothetical protein LUI12_08190 [Clostridiales bacterium]|nr:hypothetical protein [Clostridiales bacterium]